MKNLSKSYREQNFEISFSVVPTVTLAVISTTLFIENFKTKKKSKKLKSLLKKKIGTSSKPALLKIVNFVTCRIGGIVQKPKIWMLVQLELRNLQN